MMIQKLLTTIACVLLFVVPHVAQAKSVTLTKSPFVDHPVHHPIQGRSASAWRSNVGAWGENLAEASLQLRGYNEVHEIKNGKNNGIDRVAIKRGPDGKISDAKFAEAKFKYSGKPKLGKTKNGGTQMSRKWLSNHLKQMSKSADPALRKLALDLKRFIKGSGKPLESFGELMHLSMKTGKITGYSGDGRTMKYKEDIGRLLKKIQKKAKSPEVRNWAKNSSATYKNIRQTSMSNYLGKSVAQQSSKSIISKSGKGFTATRTAVLRQSQDKLASTALTQIMKRAAGPIGLVVALAQNSKELFDIVDAYRNGAISVRQRNVQLITTLGGMGGASAGAWAGGATGAAIGTLSGGPMAWATAPVGAILGIAIGGTAGYFGGSAIASYGSNKWYNSIDASVRNKFEISWLEAKGMGQ